MISYEQSYVSYMQRQVRHMDGKLSLSAFDISIPEVIPDIKLEW